jgi:hypothetical protein
MLPYILPGIMLTFGCILAMVRHGSGWNWVLGGFVGLIVAFVMQGIYQ